MTSIISGCSGMGVAVGVAVGVGMGVSVGVADGVEEGGIGVAVGSDVAVAVGTASSGDAIGDDGAPPHADRTTAVRISRLSKPNLARARSSDPARPRGSGNRIK
jgi:hypothetical protein